MAQPQFLQHECCLPDAVSWLLSTGDGKRKPV
jgi:hypothetical protein